MPTSFSSSYRGHGTGTICQRAFGSWKTKIEETDADHTFSVGLIYGPSGCGKSSLVKAGLLPRLDNAVVPVYVEATAKNTEDRLLRGLYKHCPNLPAGLTLTEAVKALRQGHGLATGRKVLLVLDQFEQWLHARLWDENNELVQALRQCDGGRVHCLLMVRDDFWLGVSRFMATLEVELSQSRNTALVDRFDVKHAKKVLAAFGRAFGTLPETNDARTKNQNSFLEQAVAELAPDGYVDAARLALFAEMVKGRPWEPATLWGFGGAAGVGVAFLETTFYSAAANPTNRLHRKAALAVLKELLPSPESNIKGNMQSYDQLLKVSGYGDQHGKFEEVLRVLNSEVRLITPAEATGADSEAGQSEEGPAARYYQLTHDYLVPSLREWITGKDGETPQGRAKLRLEICARVWNAKPERRMLPSFWEWSSILRRTDQRNWTPPEQRMMRAATWYHALRGATLAALLVAVTAAGLLIRHAVIECRKPAMPKRWSIPWRRRISPKFPASSKNLRRIGAGRIPFCTGV